MKNALQQATGIGHHSAWGDKRERNTALQTLEVKAGQKATSMMLSNWKGNGQLDLFIVAGSAFQMVATCGLYFIG